MDLFPLPTITAEPAKHYGSCTFLSKGLLEALSRIVPEAPEITLSVGSGIGLLEALINRISPERCVECVEVSSFSNERKYVPEGHMQYIQGTWQICSRARAARMWMFIFPRDPELLKKYVTAHGDGKVEHVLWIGPRSDFTEYKDSVEHEKFNNQGEFGQGILQQNEMGWLWSHKHTTSDRDTPCQLQSCPLSKHDGGESNNVSLDLDSI